MKQPDHNKVLFEAVSGIDPGLIDEAMEPQRLRKPLGRRIIRFVAAAAAVLAVFTGSFFAWLSYDGDLVMTPGAAGIGSYNISDDQQLVYQPMNENESILFPTTYYDFVNIVPGMPFSFYFESDTPLTLSITVNSGGFEDWIVNIDKEGNLHGKESMGILGREFTIENNRTIYWHPLYSIDCSTLGQPEKTDHIYLEVILRSESHIVGYCVIEIQATNPEGSIYSATVLQSAYYPPQNGKFQEVSEAFIRKKILQAKILK